VSNNDHDDDYWCDAFELDKFIATNQAIRLEVELMKTNNDNFMVESKVGTHYCVCTPSYAWGAGLTISLPFVSLLSFTLFFSVSLLSFAKALRMWR
jgi:hypothetical protein